MSLQPDELAAIRRGQRAGEFESLVDDWAAKEEARVRDAIFRIFDAMERPTETQAVESWARLHMIEKIRRELRLLQKRGQQASARIAEASLSKSIP